MHAEVLAKKGFMLYVKNCLAKNQTEILECGTNEITIHFYVSSAPCGNSVIKKWAKPTLGINFEDMPDNKWPEPTDEKFHYTAKHEGQGCLLVKKSSKDEHNEKIKFIMPSATQHWSTHLQTFKSSSETIKDEKDNNCTISHEGTSKPSLTCSDKILFWQHIGVQGSYLLKTGYFKAPLRLATITVGRKYSEPHLRRALFGRYIPTKIMLNEGAPQQQPISCLVTSLKLDQSVYIGDDEESEKDASFTDPRCYWWCQLGNNDVSANELSDKIFENEYVETLDGRTGLVWETNELSKISPKYICKNILESNPLSLSTSKSSSAPPYNVIDYKQSKCIMFKYFESVQPTDVY